MLKRIRSLFAVAAFAVVTALPTQVFAVPTNALYMVMDGSGSISAANWQLQVNGYITALNNVFSSGGYYGGTAIGVAIFGYNVKEIYTMHEINNVADLSALTSAIGSTLLTRGGVNTGATAIGDAINLGASRIQGLYSGSTNKVIDVSTDGANNTGFNPALAANNAFAQGIHTNCIGIGPSANCSFVGTNGFQTTAADFAAFQRALEDKLKKELVNVPEPASLLLLGVGLTGLGFSRRGKKS